MGLFGERDDRKVLVDFWFVFFRCLEGSRLYKAGIGIEMTKSNGLRETPDLALTPRSRIFRADSDDKLTCLHSRRA